MQTWLTCHHLLNSGEQALVALPSGKSRCILPGHFPPSEQAFSMITLRTGASNIWQTLAAGERLRPWRWCCGLFLVVGAFTRVALFLYTGPAADPTPGMVLAVLLLGIGADLVAASFFFVPMVLFLAVFPATWRGAGVGRAVLLSGMTAWVALIFFVAAAEWIFWGEFGTRFNFIAVDYLVYTHEVITNIWESYPVLWVCGVIAAASAGLVRGQRSRICATSAVSGWRTDLPAILTVLLLPAFAWAAVPSAWQRAFSNEYANELAGNGMHEFFRAFDAAQLDYKRFYPSLPVAEAYARVRRLLPSAHVQFTSADPFDLTRRAHYDEPPRDLNVVLISVESLSAEFMTRFGGSQGITPNLDNLARDGLLFTNHYATGTRTVRALEALSLSVPPTPGESIVKRPDNSGFMTLGGVLAGHEYDVRYLYGGYAFFDNMRTFFSGNGYTVIDRGAIPPQRIHHETAWGVADEDIFTQALLEIDQSHAAGRRSFTQVMTTSNHRPYTYPEGRIDLPPGISGRPGAVKYTDWAIGDFIARARAKPWFDSTVFVIVGDHCASSAGKTTLPLANYLVPLLFYAPGIVAAEEDPQLASQIDVAPTLLGLLRMDYAARFFGRDLREPSEHTPYVFISTYQQMGFVRDGQLIELGPLHDPQVRTVGESNPPATPAQIAEATQDAIALYQVAADVFDSGALRWDGPG